MNEHCSLFILLKRISIRYGTWNAEHWAQNEKAKNNFHLIFGAAFAIAFKFHLFFFSFPNGSFENVIYMRQCRRPLDYRRWKPLRSLFFAITHLHLASITGKRKGEKKIQKTNFDDHNEKGANVPMPKCQPFNIYLSKKRIELCHFFFSSVFAPAVPFSHIQYSRARLIFGTVRR